MLHRSRLLIYRISTLPFETLSSFAGVRASGAAEALLLERNARACEAERISGLLYACAGAAPPPGQSGARGAVLRLRRAIHQDRPIAGGMLEQADPLLTAELRACFRSQLETNAEIERADRDFSCVFAEEVVRCRTALVAMSHTPLFRLGLRLAARALLRRVESLTRVDPPAWDQRDRHTASKLLAYLGRFATKTSPNGVFCATGLGEVTEERQARLCGENQIARLEFLVHVGEARKITACLASTPDARNAIVPRPNPTLRWNGSQWDYWRPATARRPEDDEVRCAVKDHAVMRMVLDAAAPERDTEEAIIQTVQAMVGQDVRPFYTRLVEQGILIGEVEVPWSERRPLRALASRCPGASWSGQLEAIEAGFDLLSELPVSEIAPKLDDLVVRLDALPHARPLAADDLIRCDASSRLAIGLPQALLRDLERLVPLYARLYGAIYPESLTREYFAARFLQRYPADTPVPVLDFYHGLFEPAEAARPAAFASPASAGSGSERRNAAAAAFERARKFFAGRASETAAREVDEVELTEGDWAAITGAAAEPRFACAVLFQVAATSAERVIAPNARVCLNAFFPGAGLSVARLAHLHARDGNDPIVDQLRRGWARQARPGAAHAEITFMHGGRTANAGLRPPIFPFEIELPGDRVTDGRASIPLSDLTARWESAEGRFVLRSLSRGIEILPVISSGINPEGFVSFLTMVGGQDLQPLGLFPGFDVPGIRSWPRFRFGNVVLFRRRWVFDGAELPTGASPEDNFVAVQRWRRENGMPFHVFIHSERDPKPFYVDLGSVAFVDLFRRATLEGLVSRVHVTEMLPGPADLWVRDSRGSYASEFLLHLDNLGGPETEGGG